jgi:hypothetical protein
VSSLLRRWNCSNCGRANKTAIGLDGTAKCEYCTDVIEVQPLWGRRLLTFAAQLLSPLLKASGCIQWRPVLAKAGVRSSLAR